jgi:hypothetical protein
MKVTAKKTTKYFIVAYSALNDNDNLSVGNLCFSLSGVDPFPNRLETNKRILDKNKNLLGCSITNIMEVRKSQYEKWNFTDDK